jgi:hypothetical protein
MYGWFCRLRPTPGRSTVVGMPSAARSAAGPMPERSSKAGEWIPPAQTTTWRAWYWTATPSRMASTPVTVAPLMRSRVTWVLGTICRLGRARTAAVR